MSFIGLVVIPAVLWTGGMLFILSMAPERLFIIVMWILLGILISVHSADTMYEKTDGNKNDPQKSTKDTNSRPESTQRVVASGEIKVESNSSPYVNLSAEPLEEDGVEILLHNVSHSDLVLSLNDLSRTIESVVARPKFYAFHEVGQTLNAAISLEGKLNLVEAPLLLSSSSGAQADAPNVPIGFDITEVDCSLGTAGFRFRREDNELRGRGAERCRVDKVYFPLIAVLLPKWLRLCATRAERPRRVIYLISGVGTANDEKLESEHPQANSTKHTGLLIKRFIEVAYPNIEVVCVHDENSNLFRYDANIVFVKKTLMKTNIDPIRNNLAEKHGDRWSDMLRLTMSFADGSSARIISINSALRGYRPTYLHFWRLKNFWHRGTVNEDDIESHSFEDVATVPAISVSEASLQLQKVVAEMKLFKAEFDRVRSLPSSDHDLTAFWLRKTKKPVLAVLLVQKPNGEYRLYRGTNMEVSMPTGSLCAERNVIGSALAADITLKRQDLRCVAVLSATLDPPAPPSSPQVSSKFSSPQEESPRSPRQKPPPLMLPPNESAVDSGNYILSPSSRSGSNLGNDENTAECQPCDTLRVATPRRNIHIRDFRSDHKLSDRVTATGRVVQTVAVDLKDMNPLKPCGACSEWLKKIIEVNPSFSVITFTDSDCSGIYVE